VFVSEVDTYWVQLEENLRDLIEQRTVLRPQLGPLRRNTVAVVHVRTAGAGHNANEHPSEGTASGHRTEDAALYVDESTD
jgi:hypothetical protein